MRGESGEVLAGRYRILGLIGRGGMGSVWRAYDTELDREVAVKELRLPDSVDDAERRHWYARAEREARAAARLRHPGIVALHDRVIGDDGRPWLVMELVGGQSLDAVIRDDGPLSPARAAAIGAQMLDALTTAHAHGIVHRDVKPANVLLEGDRAILTDFGIAALDGDATLTRSGVLLGTPAYMAPEQVRGLPATAASDLWSLGATLYAAVEGRPPFGGSTHGAIFVAIATEPPPHPANAGPLTEAITSLLHKDPQARPTAESVRPLLTPPPPLALPPLPAPSASPPSTSSPSRPPESSASPPSALSAPPPSAPSASASSAPSALALSAPPPPPATPDASSAPPPSAPSAPATSAGTTLAAAPAAPAVQQAVPAALAESAAPPAPPAPGTPAPDAPVPDIPALDASASSTVQDVQGETQVDPQAPPHRRGRIAGAATLALTLVLVVGGAFALHGLTSGESPSHKPSPTPTALPSDGVLATGSDAVWGVAFSPDGKTLASADGDDALRLWDTRTGAQLATLKPKSGDTDRSRHVVVFSPDGRTLATENSDDHQIEIWDVATRRVTTTFSDPDGASATSAAFSPDGSTLAVGVFTFGADAAVVSHIRVWDVASRQLLFSTPDAGGFVEPAFSPDGRTLVYGGRVSIVLWDVAQRKLLRTIRASRNITSVAFSPDGHDIAATSAKKPASIWDVATGKLRHELPGGVSGKVAYSHDGRLLATSAEEGGSTVQLWDPATGKAVRTFGSGTGVSVAISSDAKLLAGGNTSGQIHLWRL